LDQVKLFIQIHLSPYFDSPHFIFLSLDQYRNLWGINSNVPFVAALQEGGRE